MAYTSLLYHIVFSTKQRRSQIQPEVLSRLCEYIGGIVRNEKGQMLIANGTSDHIHLAVVASPACAVADLLRVVKSNSSRWVHETFPSLREFAWQDSYSAFTVSQSVMPKVIQYIRAQAEHHHKMTFQEELVGLLQRHGVAYDERYIWS